MLRIIKNKTNKKAAQWAAFLISINEFITLLFYLNASTYHA